MKVEVTTLAPVNSGGQDIKIVVDTDTEAWSDGWCSGSDFNLLDEEIISIIQSVMTHGDVITRDSMIARPLPSSRSASRQALRLAFDFHNALLGEAEDPIGELDRITSDGFNDDEVAIFCERLQLSRDKIDWDTLQEMAMDEYLQSIGRC